MGYFLQELKRRNVFRVGAAYLVVGWVIIQIVETISGPLGLPEWTEAFFIVLLAAGLPVALVFAWAFELTPDGMKKTREVEKESSVTHETGRKLNFAIIGALVVALAFSLFGRGLIPGAGTEEPVEEITTTEARGTSIAVLPFVDMSPQGDQEYFSDGISEELLNVLARVPELRVAARTSSFQFKGQNLDIPLVAEQLNVEHVLEGSVRKSGNRIRITAQLIEADSGYHLWSENYDRELVDIFGIQDEISHAIVAALSATLGIEQEQAPETGIGTSPEAYNVYLLGQHLIRNRTKGDIEAAIPQFQKAIELDPDYAPAHASLALATYLLSRTGSTYGDLPVEEALAAARPHAERALELDPNSADANAVTGLLLYADNDAEEAEPYFERALEINPSHNDVRNWYSSALTGMERYDEALAVITDAFRLDPLSNLTFNNYANELLERRRLDELEAVLDSYEQVDPGRASQFRALIRIWNREAAEGVALMLESADEYPEYLRLRASASFFLGTLGIFEGRVALWPYEEDRFLQAAPYDIEGQLAMARSMLEETPDDVDAIRGLAFALLWAGQTEEAREQAEKTLQVADTNRIEIDGANFIIAMADWRSGDVDAALERLAPLEAFSQRRIDAGIYEPFDHMMLAVTAFLRDDVDGTVTHYDAALSGETVRWEFANHPFNYLGWSDHPRLATVHADYDAYLAAERAELLQRACGEIGFNAWRPAEATCQALSSGEFGPD